MALVFGGCQDSNEHGRRAHADLDIPRAVAATLGHEAVRAAEQGRYTSGSGRTVEWADLVAAAREAKISIPPDAPLPIPSAPPTGAGPAASPDCRVTVANLPSLGAARDLGADRDSGTGRTDVLVLNLANGVAPGGGFLSGSRAQEEYLCRSSALFETLRDDPMYEAHRKRDDHESSDHAILSPGVPVFRDDSGEALDTPWTTSFITAAAPVAHRVGRARSSEIMAARTRRILDIAAAHGYRALVLGAWGCGAFGNDTAAVAGHFRAALEERSARFDEVVFAISDWSPERRFLGPFCAEFGTSSSRDR